MKRLNYYQVHRNKKPRSKRNKRNFVSVLAPLMAITTAMSAVQMANIQTQPIPNYQKGSLENINTSFDKLNKSIGVTTELMKSIAKITKSEQQRRFKLTKRYVS